MNMESGQSSMDLVQGFRWNHGGDRCPHMTQVRWDSAWRQSLCSCWPFPVLTHLSAYWVLTLLLCILSTLVSPVPNTSSLPDLELRLYPFSAVLSESSGTLPAQGLLLSELVPTTSAQCCLPKSSCKVEFWVIWPLMHADWLSCELCYAILFRRNSWILIQQSLPDSPKFSCRLPLRSSVDLCVFVPIIFSLRFHFCHFPLCSIMNSQVCPLYYLFSMSMPILLFLL